MTHSTSIETPTKTTLTQAYTAMQTRGFFRPIDRVHSPLEIYLTQQGDLYKPKTHDWEETKTISFEGKEIPLVYIDTISKDKHDITKDEPENDHLTNQELLQKSIRKMVGYKCGVQIGDILSFTMKTYDHNRWEDWIMGI